MTEWIAPAAAVLVALVALGLAVALLRARSAHAQVLAAVRAESTELRERLDRLERSEERSPSPSPEPAHVITRLGEEPSPVPAAAPTVDGRLFADLVLRESVVQAASLAHGVRRALAPETRNRIRFEMRREVKRARKQRRADLREAKRDWAARQRADLNQEGSAA
ncbi:hypothetical protein [Nocardioides sp. W7]|uniref:hypothetical protein n=1 Tax=Nocardioides sp. W7 TaxID=2931390 RepID=UPI001FD3A4CC|nr:hypothetical protein [Nocardioides sp. W7]